MDALSRETLHTVFSNVVSSVPAIAALNLRRALGPLRPVVLPVATPLEVMSRCTLHGMGCWICGACNVRGMCNAKIVQIKYVAECSYTTIFGGRSPQLHDGPLMLEPACRGRKWIPLPF